MNISEIMFEMKDTNLKSGGREKMIGKPVLRREDDRLVKGQSRFVEDLPVNADTLHMKVLRSPHAYAQIKAIDTDKANQLPGVVSILTASSLTGTEGLPADWVPQTMAEVPMHPILAKDEVLYVGQPVAIVIAKDVDLASIAVEQISVDYAVKKPVIQQEAALESGSPQLHPEVKNNKAYSTLISSGDVAAKFRQADVVLKKRLTNNRITAASLEGRSVLSTFDKTTGELLHHSSSQLPHVHARALAKCLGFPMHKLRFVSPDVGGGFGGKLGFYVEDVLCAFASIQTGRAIRWIGGRDEFFLGTTHGRDHVQYAEVAANKDGKILAFKVKILADLGAFAMGMGPGVPSFNAGISMSGPYKIPDIDIEVVGAFTNRMPTGPYRGAGHPEATYCLERVMDDLAKELGMDPVEVRRRNLVKLKDMPYLIPTGMLLDGGDYEKNLDKALEMVGYSDFQDQKRKALKEGRHLGLGVSFYAEMSGACPTLGMYSVGFNRTGAESARIVMHPDGKVTVFSGSHCHGQGHKTSFSQIAADIFQIPMDHIDVVQGDTKSIPFGTGTFNSRSMAVGGTAILKAGEKILKKASKIAAYKLQCRAKDLEYVDGVFRVKPGFSFGRQFAYGFSLVEARVRRKIFNTVINMELPIAERGQTEISIAEVAREAHIGHDTPLNMPIGLDETVFYDPKVMTVAFGTHICVVEVDSQTGETDILRYVAVDDCGRVINPVLAEGQVHGGVAMGLGQAMMEEVVYDEENGQLLTESFAEYHVPRASDLPDFESAFTVSPPKDVPIGARGVGEGGTIGAPPAIVNAVLDALEPLGVKDIEMPMTPSNVWNVIQESNTAKNNTNWLVEKV